MPALSGRQKSIDSSCHEFCDEPWPDFSVVCTLSCYSVAHGGQICLPGGIPITLDSVLPRSMGSGAWKYHGMIGYTSVGAGSSVVPVRFNCPPEITLHHFHLSN
jgi:hypothetical protein